ncbi:cell division protein PerM [Streptomyces fragilis]|uniref:DUF6350 family protein n=2 Tax=Streptomyces fragilis TaxID=67301 RepID=A0ABV2YN20_9ACTN|nr:DUF6350 family protein [Streptomyces fragilis]
MYSPGGRTSVAQSPARQPAPPPAPSTAPPTGRPAVRSAAWPPATPSAPRRLLVGLLLRLVLRLRLRLLLGRAALGAAVALAAGRGTAAYLSFGDATNRADRRPHPRVPSLPPLSAVAAGLAAAGTGLVVLAVPVLFLWMTSPYPGSGPGNALHTTAALWLSAHGVDLVRTDTLSAVPAPMGVGPLLLTALPVWLLHRAGRSVAEDGDRTDGDRADGDRADGDRADGDRADDDAPPAPGPAWAGVTAGYVTAGLLAALYATGGEYRPGWGWSTLFLPALAAVVSLSGMWAGSDHLRRTVDRTAGRLPDLLLGRADRGRRLGAAFRAAGEGAAALLCGGALLAVLALVLRAGEAGAAFGRLAGGWVSGVTLLLLCLALLPNAAVWAAAYATGAGFLLGPAMVAPLGGWGPVPRLPAFPWLAAVPTGAAPREGAAPAGGTAADVAAGADVTSGADVAGGVGDVVVTWLPAVLPLLAGVAIGVRLARRAAAARTPWPWLRTAVLAVLGCLICGAALAALAGLAGGPLGRGTLAAFGPVWWRTGLATAAWTLLPALLSALLVRWDRLRR